MTVMTHVKALQAGHSSQGTSEPITPDQHPVLLGVATMERPLSGMVVPMPFNLKFLQTLWTVLTQILSCTDM